MLGTVLREQRRPSSKAAYTEALELDRRIGDSYHEAITAHSLAGVYLGLPELRDLDQAEHWIQYALERYDARDRLRRAMAYSLLGFVDLERFEDARSAGRPAAELLGDLNAALDDYREALDLTPPEAIEDMAITHNQLGLIY